MDPNASSRLAASVLLAIACAFSLLACGTVATATPKEAHPVPVPPAAPAVAGLSRIETQVLDAINAVREKAGLARLVAATDLSRIARAHSEDQARRGRMGHEGSGGTSPVDRARAAGIAFQVYAENVGMNYGYDDPAREAVRGWMESQHHRENILNPVFTRTGIGVAKDKDGKAYFTQVFLYPALAK